MSYGMLAGESNIPGWDINVTPPRITIESLYLDIDFLAHNFYAGGTEWTGTSERWNN